MVSRLFLSLLLLASVFFSISAMAQTESSNSSAGASSQKKDELGTAEEIISGPFSEYGEFDSSEDEAADEKFFQFGRFFGLGLGVGMTGFSGNAGKLYRGGFPQLDFKVNYWFDFHFALQAVVQNSRHTYDRRPDGLSDVNLFRVLFQVKYYFDTHDLSAPITFVGPHLIAGGGFYQRTDNRGSGATLANGVVGVETQNTFGFNFGGGLELTLKPKKTYVQFEALAHIVNFADQYDPRFSADGVKDRTGMMFTGSVALVWTW